jgi:hypothetical protein
MREVFALWVVPLLALRQGDDSLSFQFVRNAKLVERLCSPVCWEREEYDAHRNAREGPSDNRLGT